MKKLTLTKPLMWWLIFIGVMSVLPAFLPPTYTRICISANYLAVFAMGWDILSGYTGYVSFGHPFIIGIAGYTSAMLSNSLGLPIHVTMPIGIGVGVGSGMLFFLPALRLRGNYFCLVTLAFMVVLHHLIIAVRPDLTGGTRGITMLPVVATGEFPNFYISLGIMVSIAVLFWNVSRSDLGTVFNAIRMDEDVVSSTGLNTFKYKLIAFTLSALALSVGAVFFTHYTGSISPRGMFSIDFLLTIIIAVLIGGQNTIIGPIIGSYFLTFVLEYLRPYIPGTPRFLLYTSIAFGIYLYNDGGFHSIIKQIAKWYRGKRAKGQEYG